MRINADEIASVIQMEIEKYESQLEVARPYFKYEFQESMARVRGLQVKAEYAEAYEAIRVRL